MRWREAMGIWALSSKYLESNASSCTPETGALTLIYSLRLHFLFTLKVVFIWKHISH